MVITCPSCSERYRLNPDKLKGKGARITCPKCSHAFVVLADQEAPRKRPRQRLDTRSGAFQAVGVDDVENSAATTGSIRVVAPGPRGPGSRKQIATVDTSGVLPSLVDDEDGNDAIVSEETEEKELRASDLDFREVGIVTWKVKVAIGLVYDFSDISTLKKYLADKKVTPDDLISYNAKDWVRIGDLDDLDNHFVTTWHAARAAMKEEDRPSAKKAASTPAVDTGQAESIPPGLGSKSSSQEAAEQVAALRKRRTKLRREQAMADQKRMRTRTFAAVMGATLVVALLFGAFWMRRTTQEVAESSPVAATEGIEADAAAASKTEDGVEDVAAVRDRIRQTLDRRRQEIQAGVLADAEPIVEEPTEPVPEDEALIRARRVPVRPSEQSTSTQPSDSGFRKPTTRQPAPRKTAQRTAAQVATSRDAGNSAGTITEKRTRDPGLMYYDHGVKKLSEKNYGAALKMFQRSVDKSPGCGRCWEGLAQAHKALGNASEAAHAFNKAEGLGIPVNASRP